MSSKITKLETLTPEQLALIPTIRQKWLDRFFKFHCDEAAMIAGTKWLYQIAKLKEPMVIILDSPLGIQYAANMLKQLFRDQVRDQVGDQVGAQVGAQVGDQVVAQVRDQVRDQVGAQVGAQVWAQVRDQVWDQVWAQVGDQVRAQVRDQVGDQVRDQVRAQVRDQVWAQVGDQVRAQVGDQVRAQVRAQVREYFNISAYGNASDYGWLSFYDYFDTIGIDLGKHKMDIRCLSDYMASGVFHSIQLTGFCIISKLPVIVRRDSRNRLHSEEGPAVGFADGFELYYWKGTRVPMHYITSPYSITDEEIKIASQNAETRRVLIDILGVTAYFARIGSVLEVIDQENDHQGYPMKLMTFEFERRIIQVLECTCPSTERIYNLYPPNQQSRNVWDAKASICGITTEEVKSLVHES